MNKKTVKNKEIKDFMQLKGLDNKAVAELYNMPYSSFTNKLNQRDFKLNEILQLLSSQNCKLAILDENEKTIITFATPEEDKY